MNILDELMNVHKMVPPPKWRQDFEKYLLSIPSYYYSPMKNGIEISWKILIKII